MILSALAEKESAYVSFVMGSAKQQHFYERLGFLPNTRVEVLAPQPKRVRRSRHGNTGGFVAPRNGGGGDLWKTARFCLRETRTRVKARFLIVSAAHAAKPGILPASQSTAKPGAFVIRGSSIRSPTCQACIRWSPQRRRTRRRRLSVCAFGRHHQRSGCVQFGKEPSADLRTAPAAPPHDRRAEHGGRNGAPRRKNRYRSAFKPAWRPRRGDFRAARARAAGADRRGSACTAAEKPATGSCKNRGGGPAPPAGRQLKR